MQPIDVPDEFAERLLRNWPAKGEMINMHTSGNGHTRIEFSILLVD